MGKAAQLFAQDPSFNDLDKELLFILGITVLEHPAIWDHRGRESLVWLPAPTTGYSRALRCSTPSSSPLVGYTLWMGRKWFSPFIPTVIRLWLESLSFFSLTMHACFDEYADGMRTSTNSRGITVFSNSEVGWKRKGTGRRTKPMCLMVGHPWCICRFPEKKVKRKPQMGLVLGVPRKGKNVHEESDTAGINYYAKIFVIWIMKMIMNLVFSSDVDILLKSPQQIRVSTSRRATSEGLPGNRPSSSALTSRCVTSSNSSSDGVLDVGMPYL